MKKAVKHILVFLLTTTVFLSSVGLSVHNMYCYCKGEMMASLFCISDPCEVTGAAQNGGCCDGGNCHQAGKPGQHECSNCNSEYVKLDASYLIFSSDYKIYLPATTPYSPLVKIWQPVTIQDFLYPVFDGPPPPSGKTLLPWVQSFLC